ncbi:hypothetical protein PCPL58_5045 [Pseudomonas cerasi]|uniref:Uncharacterized protein n=1 Tax=Pseudomonas cerasi TaxID=1583341 RepID=A0A193SW85_9PSED|nr:hypothetical protein PCPL58_5045 [Pseudomonas cerasi]SOS24238.1 hypothetical protein PL963_05148 [Pseudomonas cerasi]
MNFHRLHRPLREQARSHRSAYSASNACSLTGATQTARQSARPFLRLIQVCRGERALVGASRATLRVLAKVMVQTMSFRRLHWPLREQARSHRSAYSASNACSLTGATRTARQSARPVLRLIQVCRVKRVFVGASRATLRLLAKAIVQAMSFCGLHRPLREQARSHRSAYSASTARSLTHRCNTNCPTKRTACSLLSCSLMPVCRVRRARPRRW